MMTFTPDERFYISDIETLAVLADPHYFYVLESLGSKPQTLAALVVDTNLAQDTLLDILHVLHAHGLVHIIEEASNTTDVLYAASAIRYVMDENLQPLSNPMAANAALNLAFATMDRVKTELEHHMVSLFGSDPEHQRAEFGKGRLYLTRSEAEELAQELSDIWERYRKEDPGPNTEPYSLFISFFATPNP